MRYHELFEAAFDSEDGRRYEDGTHTRFGGYRLRSIFRELGDNGETFFPIKHRPDHHSPERPLVIVVHPGDMIEYRYMWDDPVVRDAVMSFWQHNEHGTTQELAEWRKKGADFVVLHRSSCEEFQDIAAGRYTGHRLWAEIKLGHKRGTMLFGDDLDRASAWIIANLHVVDRPHIFLAGAYSDPKDGCLTTIGRKIEAVVGPERISVSKFSPPEASPGKVWRPGDRAEDMEVSDEVRANFDRARAAGGED